MLFELTVSDVDARRIFDISLPRFPHEDYQSSVGEVFGEFTIRSAYIIILQKFPMSNSLQTHIDYKSFYRKLWSLEIPFEQKITFWRFTKNFIPNLCNLQIKKVSHASFCPRCDGGVETTIHALKDCPVSNKILQHMNWVWIDRELQM